MSNDSYVTNAAWLRQVGRPDQIDDVADQFERPVAVGMAAFWAPEEGIRWPHSPRGWRAVEPRPARLLERRAG